MTYPRYEDVMKEITILADDKINIVTWREDEQNPYMIQNNKIEVWVGFLQWNPKIFSENTPYNSAIKVLDFIKGIK